MNKYSPSAAFQDVVTPDYWHQRAVSDSQAGELHRAARLFEHSIVLNPHDRLLRYDLGVCLVKANRLHEADVYFADACRLDPLWEEPKQIRDEIRTRMAGASVQLQSNGEFDFLVPVYSPNGNFSRDVKACVGFVNSVDTLFPAIEANAVHQLIADHHIENTALCSVIACRLRGVDPFQEFASWATVPDCQAAVRIALEAVKQRPEYLTLLIAAQVLQAQREFEHALVIVDRLLAQFPSDELVNRLANELLTLSGKGSEVVQVHNSSEGDGSRTNMLQTLNGGDPASDEHGTSILTSKWLPKPLSLDDISATTQTFTREFLRSRSDWGVPSERPVFVVGLPLSGIAIIEQILASHAECHAAGALHDLRIMADLIGSQYSIDYAETAKPLPPGIDCLPKSVCRQLSQTHDLALGRLNRKARVFVDSMSMNYRLLGLAQMLFPKARIIHCVRDPLDVCAEFLRNGWVSTQNELAVLGQLIREYLILMDHWHQVLSIRFTRIAFADMVDDFENTSDSILKFVDLTCSRSPVKQSDIRRFDFRDGLYCVPALSQSSIGLWKKFEKQLDEVRILLASTKKLG